MASLEELKKIYEDYALRADKARARAGLFDGMMGLGNDPRKDSCHRDFYDQTQAWVAKFAGEEHSGQERYEAAEQILMAADRSRGEETYWFSFAAQGLVMPLIPELTDDQCRLLFAAYDRAYPQKELLPVQKKVYKLLKKRSK